MNLLLRFAILACLPAFAAQSFDGVAGAAARAREGNRAEEAIGLYRKAVRLQPSWDEGWWHLGSLLYDRDRYGEAAAALRRFARLKPDAGAGWGLLGLCEYETGEHAPAADHLVKSIHLGVGEIPSLAYQVRLRAGLLLAKFEKFDAALNLLLHFAGEGKDTPSVIEAVGLAALQIPKLPAEVSAGEKELVRQAGRATYEAGAARPENAGAAFRALADKFPAAPGVHFLYGKYLSITDPDKCAAEFLREVEISPRHAAARVHLALEYLKNGDPEKARPYAEQAATLAPGDFTARYALGRVALELGDASAAVQELEAACRLASFMPEAHFQLARAYAQSGRPADADRERAVFVKLKAEQK